MAVFERVGFREPKRMLTTYPFELSGGMRQRAMIAMALICKPALLIADEPTTALDVTTQAQILALIKELQVETGMGVMLITHDLGVVANMADEVVVMYRGEIMERGTRDEIFRSPQHPYLKALMRAVPRFDMKPDERLTPIREIRVDAAAAEAAAHGGIKPLPTGRTVLEVTGISQDLHAAGGLLSSARPSASPRCANVSLSIPAGTTIGLVGKSGSGKTTLSKIIMRAMTARCRAPCGSTTAAGLRDVFGLRGSEL